MRTQILQKFLKGFISLSIAFNSNCWADETSKKPCCGSVVISGYLDGSYNFLDLSNKFTSGDFDRAFDLAENGIRLHQAAITVASQPASGLGGLLNPFLGSDAFETASYGYNPQIGINNDIGFDVLQAFGQYAFGAFTFVAGKFLTLVGTEATDPTLDMNYSRSLLFAFATPDTHTGIRGIYQMNSQWKFILGYNNGWDNIRDWKRAKTIEYQVAYTPSQKFSLSVQGYTGIERSTSRTSRGFTGRRTLFDITSNYNATDKISIAANYDYGVQNNAFANQGIPGEAVWQGIAAYLNYKINDAFYFSLRGEDFSDRNGYRTGVAQTIEELTLTIGYTRIKNLEIRAETRHDFSNVNSYLRKHSGFPKDYQQSFGVEAYYKFSNT